MACDNQQRAKMAEWPCVAVSGVTVNRVLVGEGARRASSFRRAWRKYAKEKSQSSPYVLQCQQSRRQRSNPDHRRQHDTAEPRSQPRREKKGRRRGKHAGVLVYPFFGFFFLLLLLSPIKAYSLYTQCQPLLTVRVQSNRL